MKRIVTSYWLSISGTIINKAMKQLPVVNSPVQILRMEVWVTNRNGTTTDTRDIVA